MNPFGDNIREEHEKNSKERMALLRQTYQQGQQNVRHEHQARIASVEAQKGFAARESEKIPGSFVPGPQSEPIKKTGRKYVFSVLAAVLVVSVLLGGTFLWFGQMRTNHIQTLALAGPIGKPLGPVGKPVRVTTKADGLEMSMSVTPGPYFLGELLEVNFLCQDSSNHSFPNGYEDWESLSTHTLQRPECSEVGNPTITLWKYAIGAAGYVVVQGQPAN